MGDLIEREKLLGSLPKNDTVLSLDVRKIVVDAPAVDAAPVVHGRWVPNSLETHWKCSECGNPAPDCKEYGGEVCEWMSGYCPNCGAKMDVEGDAE